MFQLISAAKTPIMYPLSSPRCCHGAARCRKCLQLLKITFLTAYAYIWYKNLTGEQKVFLSSFVTERGQVQKVFTAADNNFLTFILLQNPKKVDFCEEQDGKWFCTKVEQLW
jgi:hypothetical protein